MAISTPVAVCVFNRPACAIKLMDALRDAAPQRLFVIADGPRQLHAEDHENCRMVLQIIRERISWPCKVQWNTSLTNLGCRRRVESGLDWLFAQVDEAIILEDDCIPHPTFFDYCEAMLAHYRHRDDIGIISGFNPLDFVDHSPGFVDGESYSFSRYAQIWGWATWKRTWSRHKRDLEGWSCLRDTPWLSTVLTSRLAAAHWRTVFDEVMRGADIWSYQLLYSLWRQNALSIIPRANLVQNVGFGPDATHTRSADARAGIVARSMAMPIVHPKRTAPNDAFDRRFEQEWCSGTEQDLFKRVRSAIRMRHGS